MMFLNSAAGNGPVSPPAHNITIYAQNCSRLNIVSEQRALNVGYPKIQHSPLAVALQGLCRLRLYGRQRNTHSTFCPLFPLEFQKNETKCIPVCRLIKVSRCKSLNIKERLLQQFLRLNAGVTFDNSEIPVRFPEVHEKTES